MFLILSIALLPIAVIAIFATLQTTRLADTEARARLRVAGVGVGLSGGTGAIGCVHESGNMVCQPAGERVRGFGLAEFSEDALAQCGQRVSGW